MAISAEQLNIILSARDKEFTKAMDRAQRRVERFGKTSQSGLSRVSASFIDLGSAAKKLGPLLAGALSVSTFRGAVEGAVEIGNLSKIAGAASEDFQVLSLVTAQFGVSQEKLADILKDVNDKFGDFTQTGAGPLQDFFDNIAPKVGLTASAFADLSSDQKLGAYINALKTANLTQSEMTFYMEAIASDSTALIEAFDNNGAAIDDMRRKAEKLGIILDEDMIQKSREAKGELDLMSQVIGSQLSQALINIAPLIASAAQGIVNLSAAAREFLNGFGAASAPQVSVADAVNEYEQFKDLYDEVFKAQSMVAGFDRRYAEGVPVDLREEAKAVADLAAAEKALADAKAAVAKQDASREAFKGTVSGILRDNAALEEQIRLQGMSADEVVRANAARQKAIFLDKAIAEAAAATSDGVIPEAVITRIYELADLNEKLTIQSQTTSKAIAGGSREVRDAAVSAEEAIRASIEEMIKASPLLQQLGLDAQGLQGVMSTVQSSMEDAFMGMIDGTQSAGDAFKSMARDIIKELYRVLVVQQLVGSFTSGGGGILGAVYGAVGGAAAGGVVQAGQPTVVGEHGRELFVPSQGGRVLSVAQSKDAISGGGNSVTVIQNNTFGSGVSRAEINSMLPKIVETTKAAVFDAQRRSVTGR